MKQEFVNVPNQDDTQPERTGYYQEIWNARKRMTKWCAIFALITSVIIAVVVTVNAEPADFKNMLGSAFALFVAVFVCTFPVFLLGYSIANSSVSDTAIHAAVAAITGIFTFAVSNIAYNSGHTSIFTIIAMTVSLIAMFAGGIVFLAMCIYRCQTYTIVCELIRNETPIWNKKKLGKEFFLLQNPTYLGSATKAVDGHEQST